MTIRVGLEREDFGVEPGEARDGVAVDPVCGQLVQASGAATQAVWHHGRTWHFCGLACQEEFVRMAERIRVVELARRGGLFTPLQRVRWGVA
ncbi:MAG: YHS domain protein [Anaeromyxobacter sp.]|nr:YHS domain protein [Anaeromyxobacter sp.]MBL0276779.1 YHS domain protein [Anaeromyxobacter sp.]